MRSEAIYHGVNADKELDNHVRCSRCGFICDLNRDIQAPEDSHVGWGITNTEQGECIVEYNDPTISYNSVDFGDERRLGIAGYELSYNAERTLYDPVVHQGCPQCGTLLFNK